MDRLLNKWICMWKKVKLDLALIPSTGYNLNESET